MMKTKLIVLGVLLVCLIAVSFVAGSGSSVAKEPPFLPILMYHYFADNVEPSTNSIAPDRFRDHLAALRDAGYETITDTDLAAFLDGERTLPGKPILITSDDGYLNNYEHLYPALAELDMKATIYAIVDYRGKTPGVNPHFTWEQAREMVESGHIEIHSHSLDSHKLIEGTNYSYLTGPLPLAEGGVESDEQYEQRVRHDMDESKALIEQHTGQQVLTFSYPYGKFTANTEKWAAEAGYRMSLSIKHGVYTLGDSTWAMPRITVNGKWSGEQLLEEIDKYIKGGDAPKYMISIGDEWTNLHNHMIVQKQKAYVSYAHFAKLLGLEASLADARIDPQHIVTEQGGEYVWVRSLADWAGYKTVQQKEGGTSYISLNK